MKPLSLKPRNCTLITIALACLFLSLLLLGFSNQEASSFRNAPVKKILDNGLTLIYQKDASSAVTALQILIKGGKGAEPKDKDGLAYLTTRLALEIPDHSKAQKLMSQASRVYMTGLGDYSIINVSSLSENLDETLKIISQIMLDPLFSGLRIDLIKKQMEYQKKTQEDDSINVGHNAALEKLFAGTTYEGSVLGSEESRKDIKRKDITGFYDDHFRAENMVVSAISDLEEEALAEIVKLYFNEFPGGKPEEPPFTAASPPEEKDIFIEKDSKQYFICLVYPLPELTAKNYILAYLVENLLGKGLNSRLWPLRYQQKLAYNVNTTATQMKHGGILEAYLESDKEKKEEALAALRAVLMELRENGIESEELEVTKSYSKASFLRDNETKTDRSRNLAAFEALGLGYEFLEKVASEIDAVSLEELNAYIKRILDPARVIEVVVGPKGSNLFLF